MLQCLPHDSYMSHSMIPFPPPRTVFGRGYGFIRPDSPQGVGLNPMWKKSPAVVFQS